MTRKWLYLLDGNGEPHAPFTDRVRGDLATELRALGPARLKLTVTEDRPPRSFFGFKRGPLCLVSMWGVEPAQVTPIFEELGFSYAGYEVEESAPVMYERTWADGDPTPSPILLTLLKKKPGLSNEEYIKRWHGRHTPLSLEIHPLWLYLRNVITGTVRENGKHWDGVVEEACETKNDLLQPSRFFGGPLKMLPNMIRVWADIHRFLDVPNIEVYYATEYQWGHSPGS